jgi:hypothetical protein
MRKHAVAALSAMGLAAALTVSVAASAPHVRARPVAEATHGRASGAVGRSLVKASSVKKTLVGKSGHSVVVSANAKGARRTRTRVDETLSKQRGRSEPVRQPSKLGTPKRFAANKALTPAGTQSILLTDSSKALTVDDFTRAAEGADAPAAEAETTEDDRLPLQPAAIPAAKRIATRRSVVVRSGPAPAYAMPTLPAGTLLSDGSISGAQENDVEPITDVLRAPTREEMTEEVEQPLVLPGLYRNGRLVVPAPLKGSHEILVHQNTVADDEGLERIQDDDDLRRLRAAHLLVNFTETASLHVNPELSAERRCARVWTVRFASDISRAFYARFREPLQVNSAVRTVAYQVRLQRINGNAAGTDGEAASPHLTGQALDLGKRGMSVAQIAWMRTYLLPLMQAGKVDVEEEFQQACFHISVYRTYLPAVPAKRRTLPRTEVAQLHVPRVARASARVADDSR